MKKLLICVLLLSVCCSLFCSCNNTPSQPNIPPDNENNDNSQEITNDSPAIWDGSIASSFQGGDGTESNPYQISSPSQLAYLAQQINSGANYKGKYFSLTRDIDLNNIEWTPIGNGNFSFQGDFNGNGHTIKNLKITNASKFSQFDTIIEKDMVWGVAGLFGICQNAAIYDIDLTEVNISVDTTDEYNDLFIGSLIGRVLSTSTFEINNITVDEANISTDDSKSSTDVSGTTAIYAGGMIGYVKNDTAAICNMTNIQNTASVICKEKYTSENTIGGIVGTIANYNKFECRNFISYLTTESPSFPMGEFYCGAFGLISNRNVSVNLSNGFSKVSINNKTQDVSGEVAKHKWNSIIGCANQVKQQNGTVSGSYNFENLFGYVEVTRDTAVESKYSLYYLSDIAVFTENNCQACITLPQGNNLDSSVWNLDNLSAPKLK